MKLHSFANLYVLSTYLCLAILIVYRCFCTSNRSPVDLFTELEAEEECESPKQNFLKTAMKKTTQSLDLFDEDANTESPTISQKSNSENIGTVVPF